MTGQPNLVSHSAPPGHIYIGHQPASYRIITMSLSPCASESSLAATSSCSGPYEPQLVQPAIPLVFVTPVFPFYARYIWLTIDAKETLASLNDPDVDIITQDIKGKVYVGCAVEVRLSMMSLLSISSLLSSYPIRGVLTLQVPLWSSLRLGSLNGLLVLSHGCRSRYSPKSKTLGQTGRPFSLRMLSHFLDSATGLSSLP